jgi:hypothetical protein
MVSAMLYLSSCCRESEDRITYYGADIYTYKNDFVQISNNPKKPYFIEVKALNTTLKGKSCQNLAKRKVYSPPIIDEGILKSEIKIFCNKAIIFPDKTISANDNLLSYPEYMLLSESNTIGNDNKYFYGTILGFNKKPDTSFAKGVYTFYVTGKTDKSHMFSDSATVMFY